MASSRAGISVPLSSATPWESSISQPIGRRAKQASADSKQRTRLASKGDGVWIFLATSASSFPLQRAGRLGPTWDRILNFVQRKNWRADGSRMVRNPPHPLVLKTGKYRESFRGAISPAAAQIPAAASLAESQVGDGA